MNSSEIYPPGEQESSFDKPPAVLGYNVDSIKQLVGKEGRDKFLAKSDADIQAWYDRYGQVLLKGDLAYETLENIVSTSSNSDVADRAHVFVDLDYLSSLSSEADREGKTVRIDLPKDSVVQIPLGMIVSAESFESWNGRPEGILKDRRPSEEVIADYAERQSPSPPLDDVNGYLLPDGRIYFKSNNAHRTAAAIKRGDSHIAFSGTMNLSILDRIPDNL